MKINLRYLWITMYILALIGFTLIPAAGSGLQEEDTYISFVRNLGINLS